MISTHTERQVWIVLKVEVTKLLGWKLLCIFSESWSLFCSYLPLFIWCDFHFCQCNRSCAALKTTLPKKFCWMKLPKLCSSRCMQIGYNERSRFSTGKGERGLSVEWSVVIGDIIRKWLGPLILLCLPFKDLKSEAPFQLPQKAWSKSENLP